MCKADLPGKGRDFDVMALCAGLGVDVLGVAGEEKPGRGEDATGGLGLAMGVVLLDFVSVGLVADADEVEGTLACM
jgi:hypothetical protein